MNRKALRDISRKMKILNHAKESGEIISVEKSIKELMKFWEKYYKQRFV